MLRFVRDPAASEDKYYDVIGFDSRGVNNTTPRYQCITEPYSRQRWTLDNRFLDLLGSSDVATEKAWARAMALADTCTGEGGPEIGEFMNNTPTVADVIEIIVRHGEWREKEANALLESEQYKQIRKDRPSAMRLDGDGGRSPYSTGASHTAQFSAPHSSPCNLTGPNGWCSMGSAMRGQCTPVSGTQASWTPTKSWNGSSKAASRPDRSSAPFPPVAHYLTSRWSLKILCNRSSRLPLPFRARRQGAWTSTYSDVMRLIKDALYDPLRLFPVLADMLTDVSRGNGSAFADMKMAAKTSICRPPSSSDGGDDDSGSLPTIYRHHPRNPGVNRLHRRLRSHRADKTRFL